MSFINLSGKTAFLLICILFAACRPNVKPAPASDELVSFDKGISHLANRLMVQLRNSKGILQYVPGMIKDKRLIVLKPFIDIDSSQVVQASLNIENIFIQEIASKFKKFEATRITLHNLEKADYLINGILTYEEYQGNLKNTLARGNEYHHIYAHILDLKENIIVATGNVWLTDKSNEGNTGLSYKPIFGYGMHPIYGKEPEYDEVIKNVKAPANTSVDDAYISQLKTRTLIVDAQTAHQNREYEKARALFKRALQTPEGRRMEVYGGLYAANFKLDNLNEARKNFGSMVAAAVETNTSPVLLPVKLAFVSGSDKKFFRDPKLQIQYAMWIEEIALYLKNNPDRCVNIIGHASKWGAGTPRGERYMKRLSKKRSDAIRRKMKKSFFGIGKKSKEFGMGSKCTIVGTIPDNAQNAIDRRVEFEIYECSYPPQRKKKAAGLPCPKNVTVFRE